MDMHALVMLTAIAVASFALSFFGAAVGLILGNLRLPLLVYYFPSTTAGMATNLIISGTGALTGTFRHARAGRLSLPVLALMGLPSLAGALLGGLFIARLDAAWPRVVIGGFLLSSGFSLLRTQPPEDAEVPTLGRLRILFEVGVGLVIGFLIAATGLMLGSLRLPMMIRWLKIDPKVAVGTNMAIGGLSAFVGALAIWPRGVTLEWLPLLIIVPPTVLGGYLGAYFTGVVRKEALQRLVGAAIVLAGVAMTAEGVWKTMLA